MIQKNASMVQRTVQLFEAFLEGEGPLFYREIEAFPYYHFIRFYVFDMILKALGWIEKPNRRESISVKQLYRLVVDSVGKGYVLGKRVWSADREPSEILALNSTKRVDWESERLDPVIDLYLRSCSRSYTVWEMPALWQHPAHTADSTLFYLDRLMVQSLLERSFVSRGHARIHQEVAHLLEWAGRFDVTLPERDLFNLIRYVLSLNRVARRQIAERLHQKRIRLILVVNHYGPLKMLVTKIAREMGIYVVELQHGNMGRYHIAYNLGHKDPLPTLPDEIFTFGSFWNRTTRIQQNGVVLTAVGMPLFEERSRRFILTKPGDKKRILFLSQETIGHRMSHVALELAQRIDPDRVEIWYKLHPREFDIWEANYPEGFIDAPIQVFADADLYDLLGRSDIHVGVYSTTVMESLVFRKQLIILEAYGAHYLTELLESGRAHLASGTEDILRIIRKTPKQGMLSDQNTQYWEENSLEKMQRRIETLLS